MALILKGLEVSHIFSAVWEWVQPYLSYAVPLIGALGAFILWLLKVLKAKTELGKARIEFDSSQNELSAQRAVEEIYPSIREWIRELRVGLITQREIRFDDLRLQFSWAGDEALRRCWESLKADGEIHPFDYGGVVGYVLRP